MRYIQNFIRNLSIKNKLIILSMVTSAIAVIITCGGFILFTLYEEKIDLINESELIGKILSQEISQYMINNDKEKVQLSLSSLRVRKGFIQACVYDASGNFFTQFADHYLVIKCSDIPRLNNNFEVLDVGVYKKNLFYKTEIRHSGKKIGSLYTISDLNIVTSKIHKSLYSSILFFCIIIICSYIISKRLQKNVSEPIIYLTDVSYTVKSGDYDVRSNYVSDDEIGELTDAFNNMLDVIKDSKENLERKVKKRTHELEKALQIKTEFLSKISHEIRTPIHGIMNYADFLVNDWELMTEKKRLEFLQKLHNNSKRLLSLINNLLDLSKLSADRVKFHFDHHDIVKLIQNVIKESEPLYITKDIKVKFKNSLGKKYNVCLDYERILQVLRNLIVNSIKFTEVGNIVISVLEYEEENFYHEISKYLMFRVSDEGIGIPEEELKAIFDKFAQGEHGKFIVGSSGLGLAICKDIIKAHHGRIWAENNKNGKGATFIFIIPLEQNKKKSYYRQKK